MENRNRKTFPICHRCVDNNEICCYCGYDTENYLNGDIGSTVATNVT